MQLCNYLVVQLANVLHVIFKHQVLLDHGTYRTLDETFRVTYCQLWKALIFLDSNRIKHIGEQFGVGRYSTYLPLIFTGRTIDR